MALRPTFKDNVTYDAFIVDVFFFSFCITVQFGLMAEASDFTMREY